MIPPEQIESLLTPYLPGHLQRSDLSNNLAVYLQLLLKWNDRTNLTAIRESSAIVQRHFGESLFAACHIGQTNSILDLGSGAGFPGVPIQLLHPDLPVTLAESQSKKAAFLQELIRTLNLPTEVWSRRAEDLPSTRTFHTVTLRAVDNMPVALAEAARRATHRILVLTTTQHVAQPLSAPQNVPRGTSRPTRSAEQTPPTRLRAWRERPAYLPGFTFRTVPIPRSDSGVLLLAERSSAES